MKKTIEPLEPIYEFHVAKKVREKYKLDESFFSLSGNVVFTNFYQVRLFVQKLNEVRDVSDHVSPGEINAAGLLDEIYHIAIRNYIKNIFPNAFNSAIASIKSKLGSTSFDNLLLDFVKVFPPKKVYKKELTEKEYLKGSTENISNKEIVLEEILLLHFANRNPAFSKIKELFDEEYLQNKTTYSNTIVNLKEFFKHDDYTIGITNSDLFDFLSRPFQIHSTSIWDQLEYIKNEWGIFIDKKLLQKIKSSKDLFIESIKFDAQDGPGGAAPTFVPKYKGEAFDAGHLVIGKSSYKYAEESAHEYDEPEQFTADTNWMPNLVLIAKNVYVWLDQLSKKYSREIKTLDLIPSEEFKQLKKWNINGLWLIGIWERSNASKRIKHSMGNIDAVASAYSLYDYQIAHDLGGEYAYNVFNEKAKKYGIRLASDMVPNHTGLYSKWMIENPDYFIQLDYPPFPNYSFTGENLSEHPDIEIRIEDQYWAMKDAAVVFERKDVRTGHSKYFYHGNDGTNMPWNDTAQLNLLKYEVREALIQKIFDVARKFSVIRFDAAMTLAKKHFSRLWYPEPGKGGDIPSRADFALTRRQFDEFFPKEFWREVVDRINQEMPDTLLLAEAFWLMEGYFVRTLGMHRVYNSAFMNMMMNEENSKYRELITNTLEFEPEILKRYVNFMSNPDEETAIDQFGDGDKYFGVLLLMSTLPGLPMFAHGQIEGYKEKYGMEYQRAYYDERPQQWLVERHEREVFPVLKKRHIFSEVKDFWLYDFLDEAGNLNEDVFIYSNEYHGEKGIVIFNNKYNTTQGNYYFSRQKLNGNSSNTNKLFNTNIADKLGVKNSDFHFYIMRDVTSGLEYLYNGSELHNNGMFLILNGYEYRVYLVFEEIFDPSGDTYNYYKANYGRGNYSVKRELDKIKLTTLHHAIEKLFSESISKNYFELISKKVIKKKEIKDLYELFEQKIDSLFDEIRNLTPVKKNLDESKKKLNNLFLSPILKINGLRSILGKSKVKIDNLILKSIDEKSSDNYLILLLVNLLAVIKNVIEDEQLKNSFAREFMLSDPIKSILYDRLEDKSKVENKVQLINVLLEAENKFNCLGKIPEEFLQLRSSQKLFEYVANENIQFVISFINSELFRTVLEVNEYEGVRYFNKERWDSLIDALKFYTLDKYYNRVEVETTTLLNQKKDLVRFVKKIYSICDYLKNQAVTSKFVLNDLFENINIKI